MHGSLVYFGLAAVAWALAYGVLRPGTRHKARRWSTRALVGAGLAGAITGAAGMVGDGSPAVRALTVGAGCLAALAVACAEAAAVTAWVPRRPRAWRAWGWAIGAQLGIAAAGCVAGAGELATIVDAGMGMLVGTWMWLGSVVGRRRGGVSK